MPVYPWDETEEFEVVKVTKSPKGDKIEKKPVIKPRRERLRGVGGAVILKPAVKKEDAK
jgi:hypothetical protein